MKEKPTIEELLEIIVHQQKQIDELQKKVIQLEEELSKYKTKKNSNNSSIPPSKDENRPVKNKSLREKTGRKVGGQKGHKDHTLEMTDSPDKVKELPSTKIMFSLFFIIQKYPPTTMILKGRYEMLKLNRKYLDNSNQWTGQRHLQCCVLLLIRP